MNGETRPLPDVTAVNRALDAIARRRRVGLHHFGHLARIEYVSQNDPGAPATMRVNRASSESAEPVGVAELGTLTDMVLGQAIREHLSSGVRLATSALDLHLSPSRTNAPVTARSQVRWLDPERGTATAACELVDDTGRVIGVGTGAFSALPAPDDIALRPVDWSAIVEGVPSVDRDELAPDETAFLTAVEAAEERESAEGSGISLVDRLLQVDWHEVDSQNRHGTLVVGPQHENRVGHLQGGAIFGVGCAAAIQLADPGHTVVDGHVQFLRPVARGSVDVEAVLLRQGRTASFARVMLTRGGRSLAEVSVTMTR